MKLETVKPGIGWQERKGYHLSATVNKAIPVQFRRADGFYHWHMDSCIVGYFLLSDSLDMKVNSLFSMLLMHEPACNDFGLTKEVFAALSGTNFNEYLN